VAATISEFKNLKRSDTKGMHTGCWWVNLTERERERPLGKSSSKVHNMKSDLAATAFEGVDWIELTQDKNKTEVVINKVLAFELH